MDYGHTWTDDELKKLEKRISKEYAQAANEVRKKLEDYFRRFEAKFKIKQEMVKRGEMTPEEYNKWRYGQIMIGKRWAELQANLAQDFHKTNEKAASMTKQFTYDAYAMNFNYGTYEAESGSGMNTAFTLYDRSTVERLVRDDPTLLPPPGKRVSERIAAGKDVLWNKQQIASVMTQGILQGESMDKIAKRLAAEVGEKNMHAAIRNARTMTTGAENAGREDSYIRAEAMGIKMQQMWIATLDGRTRHEHRLLDGQKQPVNVPFEVEGQKIRFPGDPTAAPWLVYNCRCTLIGIVEGSSLEGMKERIDANAKIKGTGESYEEWKYGHEAAAKSVVYLGNADGVISETQKEQAKAFADRLAPKEIDKFNNIFSTAEFEENTTNAYDPSANKIGINKYAEADDDMGQALLYHESTHYFDYNQNYTITETFYKKEWVKDENGNMRRVKAPYEEVIKENAGFSEYISHKYELSEYDKNTESMVSKSSEDLRNFVKKIGTSDTYGMDRKDEDVSRDLQAVREYLKSKGVSRDDPDFIHVSDFISAISYDANLGSIVGGGHSYDYWTRNPNNRVAEITASYNVLRALGRDDLIEIERDLAPNLMAMIEEEWAKIW